MKTQSQAQIRWAIRRDLNDIVNIERDCFSDPWSEDQFITQMRKLNSIAMVVEEVDQIVGFMIYELEKRELKLISMAVPHSARGQGLGRQMIEKLITKLSQQRRRKLVTLVRESNLDAQLFFKACGFMATGVERLAYDDNEDGYVFERSIHIDC